MPSATRPRYLFVDQGRAVANAAMGHIRARHALETAFGDREDAPDLVHAEVPPFRRPGRLFTRHIGPLGVWNFGSVRWHIARSWMARRLIRRSVRDGSTAAVHVTTDQVGFFLERVHRKVPCVLALDVLTYDWVRLKRGIDTATERDTPLWLKPIKPLEKRALERAPLCIAWTQTVADDVARLAPGANVATLHPGLDLDAFHASPKNRGDGPVRVLFVGGRWQAKGGPDLLRALEGELGRSVELDVVTTEDPELPAGAALHRATPGSSTIADLFARADVFCLPTGVDAVPWVVLEAMASGVPVVSTRVGSIPEMVGRNGGLVVAHGDVPALRSALLELIGDPERREAMGAAGRARAEQVYDARRNAPRLMALLDEVAAGSDGPR